MVERRLPREARRDQMLDLAATIVRNDGADALTLARVADAAGVSRPVAYDHFRTRPGLFMALYRRLDQRQSEAIRVALRQRGETLGDILDILSVAYIDCGLNAAPELGAISAALSNMIEMEAFLREERNRYAELYRTRLSRFIRVPEAEIGPLMLGIISGAEALGREAIAGRLSREAAISATRRLMQCVATG